MDLSELDMFYLAAARLLRLSSQLTICPFELFILSRNNQLPLTEF
ncbi:TPA: hypothetical protein MDQ61_003270 [Klebsiella pneumoniae]|nr:hypothetical protein LQ47_24450 [Klebsiella pneumoniae]ATU17968.1 hypothetical protein KPH11_18760 [Klebsiella pneumoniae subsp. pneumoniae]EIV9891409.1 hypothetical protein [Klebsiella pneumoniae]EIW0578730.1 hypothetical protein [Klebsiella pneumoniae]KSY17419.1 hypothetical protein APU00_20675 [Klebsiella pneumoniae]